MRSEFLPSSPKVDQAVIDATSGSDPSFEDLREALKSVLAAEGKIERDATSQGYGILLSGQHAEPTPPVSATSAVEGNELLSRVVTVGGRSHLLTAYSIGGLDVLERAYRNSHA